jgi:signal transduction histidine kinase
MLERLDSAQRAQRRFVADASHELRSPLATIRTSLELVHPHDPETSWEQLSPIVRSEAERMSRLVENLLLLSKSDDASLVTVPREVDLDDLLGAEVHRLGNTSALSIHADLPPVRVLGDEHQLTQILRNLLDNAATHARSTVAVSVSVSAREQSAVVLVDDDGPGVAPDDRARIFQRFVRLDASRSRDSGGSGLGLAIAQDLAQAHHGALSVTESPLGGARFALNLPLRPP